MNPLRYVFDVNLLNRHIANGYVAVNTHPELPLKILTYSRKAQYEQAWDSVTTQTRGMIIESPADAEIHGDSKIVAMPFPKFFNYEEHGQGKAYAPALPLHATSFQIFDKMDGSLGIVYHYDGKWRVATKGSFTSEQAQWAQARLDSRNTDRLSKTLTYMAEIVYPENRIVVDYKGREDLVLLGARSLPHGTDVYLANQTEQWSPIGSIVFQYPPMALEEIVRRARENRDLYDIGQSTPVSGTELEGFVLLFQNGTRVKIKFSDYVKLHKTATGLTTVDVWRAKGIEFLSAACNSHKVLTKVFAIPDEEAEGLFNSPVSQFDELCEALPDEMDEEVRKLSQKLMKQNDEIHQILAKLYGQCPEELMAKDRRRDFATWAKGIGHGLESWVTAAMFKAVDYDMDGLFTLVWKAIKPESKPVFKVVNEDDA